MKFYAEKDMALCGLACVLCSNEDCPGCKARGCTEGSDCTVYQCANGKQADGCYACDEFPCEEKMLQGVRNRAFNLYAREHGKQALLNRLRDNFEQGILYHRPDGIKGDYDLLSTEDEILQLIHYGKNNPYIECPVFETQHFILRLIREDDVNNLLACYSDINAQPIFNSDCCTSNFSYDTIDQMRDCVQMWIESYLRKEFVRYTLVDKANNRAVGTIEMFGMVGKYKTNRGILRLDIISMYEETAYLHELFSLAIEEFFALFAVDQIITKAIPEAADRVNALKSLGFEAYGFPGRENYWEKRKKEECNGR